MDPAPDLNRIEGNPLMRKTLAIVAGLLLLPLLQAHAMPCRSCGTNLPDQSRFCNVCGAAQQAVSAPATGRQWQSLPAKHPAQAPGAVSEQQFFQIVQPLEEYGKDLRITNLTSPLVPSLIQRTLVPGYETIRRNLVRRRLTLTPAQNRILSLYNEFYSSILSWTMTLGSERELLFPRIGQTLCLQAFLRAHPDEAGMTSLQAIEAVFEKERQNLINRNENMQENAGFENPGIAYQIARSDRKAVSDSFTFTLLMNDRGKKVGERMQVTDRSGAPLGQLKFVEEKNGLRHYSGTLSRKRFDALTSREIQVKYVVKKTFSTSWNKETLRLHLLTSLKPGDPTDYAFEALHGTSPDVTRMRFLQSIGKY